MLRSIPKLPAKCAPLVTSIRTAKGGRSDLVGTYQTAVLMREQEYKRRRKMRDLIQAERDHVASLPGKKLIPRLCFVLISKFSF